MKRKKVKLISCAVLVACSTMLVGVASGQVKIGDIEVTEAIAKEYFLDCQAKPDTIFILRDNYLEGGRGFDNYHDNEGNKYSSWSEVLRKHPLGELKEKSKDTLFAWVFLRARTPGADDFAAWFRKRATSN